MSPKGLTKLEYRQKVVELAIDVIDGKLDLFDFLDEVGGEENVYKTGDDEVDQLIDLLEHLPISSSRKYEEYLTEIKHCLTKLKSST